MTPSINLIYLQEAVEKAQNGEVSFKEVYKNPDIPVAKNEFLFFIKPEITVKSNNIRLSAIFKMIQDKIASFELNVHNVKILSAEYLEKYNIISQHYGVINKISSNALSNISEGAKDKFKDLYGKNIHDVKILGGSEFIKEYPHFNAYTLDYLWQNLENKKLAGGTYCEPIKIDDEIIYVINGFHPRQLKHFTEKGRSIVVMTLSGNISWSVARNNFIGTTNPSNANKGSIRRELLDNKKEFGLSEVSQGMNGVHLSAGPVEALTELKRYNSDFSDPSAIKDFTEFKFGNLLLKRFNGKFDDIVNNINISVEGRSTSIFDLTEELDSEDAINLLSKYLGNG